MKRNKFEVLDEYGCRIQLWGAKSNIISKGGKPIGITEVKKIKKVYPKAIVYKLVEVKL